MMTDIAMNIKRRRTEKGLSQTQLAEMLSITTKTLSNWEDGTSFPDIKMLEKLAQGLDVEIERLIYPDFETENDNGIKTENCGRLTVGFVLLSVVIYFILLVVGGGLFAIPVLKGIVGGGVEEEFILVVYWGLVLLVGYIGLCACLISENIHLLSKERK